VKSTFREERKRDANNQADSIHQIGLKEIAMTNTFSLALLLCGKRRYYFFFSAFSSNRISEGIFYQFSCFSPSFFRLSFCLFEKKKKEKKTST